MKKFILLAAAACVVGSVYAQDINNKVANGDFEAEGYEQSVPGGYTWDPWDKQNYLTVLPGWNLATGGEWNGGVEMMEEMGDDITRPESDWNYLRFIGYNDNGWTNVSIFQVVEGLIPGESYNFQYLTAARFPLAEETANTWAPDPNFGFQLAEAAKDAEGNDAAGKEIMSVNLATSDKWDNGSADFFLAGPYTFKAPADGKVYLKIYMANTYGDKNKKDNLWMLVDLVEMWSDNDQGGVESIVIDNNAPVEYFNLQGVRVANPENGLFIRRQGAQVSKVAL